MILLHVMYSFIFKSQLNPASEINQASVWTECDNITAYFTSSAELKFPT